MSEKSNHAQPTFARGVKAITGVGIMCPVAYLSYMHIILVQYLFKHFIPTIL